MRDYTQTRRAISFVGIPFPRCSYPDSHVSFDGHRRCTDNLAGDAGIRVVGDINIAALRVVNAANIEVSGDAVGIPEVPAVNVGALTAASSATSAIVNEAARLAERSRPQAMRDIPSIVTSRFLGFGE